MLSAGLHVPALHSRPYRLMEYTTTHPWTGSLQFPVSLFGQVIPVISSSDFESLSWIEWPSSFHVITCSAMLKDYFFLSTGPCKSWVRRGCDGDKRWRFLPALVPGTISSCFVIGFMRTLCCAPRAAPFALLPIDRFISSYSASCVLERQNAQQRLLNGQWYVYLF